MKIGETLYFGCYEQENLGDQTPLEWLILDIRESKALLLAKDVITGMDYHHNYTETTWADCDLRKWCNHDFYYNSFAPDERNAIVLSRCENHDPQDSKMVAWEQDTHNTNIRNRVFIPNQLESFDTLDKVFILSVEEAKLYHSLLSRFCAKPTPYALHKGVSVKRYHFIENGILSEDGIDYCEKWWLRTRGKEGSFAAYVSHDGSISKSGFPVFFCESLSSSMGVRPAIWVDLNYF